MPAEITIVWEPRAAIKHALEEDKESQASLAKRAGIDPSKLSRLLTGETKKLDFDVMQRIAAAQGRELEYYTDTPIVHGVSPSRWVPRPIEAYAARGRLRAA